MGEERCVAEGRSLPHERDRLPLGHEHDLVDHRGHGLHSAGGVFPIYPDHIVAHGCHKPGGRDGAETQIQADQRGDLAAVRITERLAGPMRLEEGGASVGGHAEGGGGLGRHWWWRRA